MLLNVAITVLLKSKNFFVKARPIPELAPVIRILWLLIFFGNVLFSEIKKPTGRVSKLQEYRLKELESYGFKTEIYKG